MRALALALLAVGCRIDLDSQPAASVCMVNTASSACIDAANASDFTFIKTKIFEANCFGGSCHDSDGSAKLKFAKNVAQADAYANLLGPDGMGAFSTIDTSRRIVVPGDPASSYMEVMVQKIPPASAVPPAVAPPRDVGFMPQSGVPLCCQKLDAIDRWIAAGAMND